MKRKILAVMLAGAMAIQCGWPVFAEEILVVDDLGGTDPGSQVIPAESEENLDILEGENSSAKADSGVEKGEAVSLSITELDAVEDPEYVQIQGEATIAETDDVEISTENFPDEIFREYVRGYFDGNNNGILETEERTRTSINVDGKGIKDLKGIEFFKSLTDLSCQSNELNSLDVSKNPALTYLNCDFNKLNSLNVSGNPSLDFLHCQNNELGSLDVSKNPALTHLVCDNNRLNSLDVSKNPNLTELWCQDNELNNLDVSENPNLTELYCTLNELESLDVSKNLNLTKLYCSGNELSSLDVSKNLNLTELDCSSNELSSLDVSKNLSLTKLDCHGSASNKLNSIDVSKNLSLIWLDCSWNDLSNLDVNKNSVLTYLNCNANKLSSLDVGSNPVLTELDCRNNQLSSLDVSKNPALTHLKCDANKLNSLDVSKNPNLTELECGSNDLSNLDVSKNPDLAHLSCYGNVLSSLDLSSNPVLKYLYCDNTFQVSDPIQVNGIWQMDLAVYVGSGNLDKVRIISEGASLSGNRVLFGQTRPTKLVYKYDTKAPALSEDEREITMTMKFSKVCDVHDFGPYVVTKPATVEEAGVQTRTCTVCGATESIEIPKLMPETEEIAAKVLVQTSQTVAKQQLESLLGGVKIASLKSGDETIVKPVQNGNLKAQKKTGKTVVTASLADGKTKKIIEVTVQKAKVKTTGISGIPKNLTLKKGKKATLKPVIAPVTSQDKVTWKSSNKKVATVSAKGVVKGKKVGKVKITVTSGKKTAIVTVTIKK